MHPFWIKAYCQTSCWPLGVSFLLHLHITRQDRRDLALHEGPRHVGAREGALLPAGAVHLIPWALSADEVPSAREAELVPGHRRTLDEVCVLQALVADGAAQRNTSSSSSSWAFASHKRRSGQRGTRWRSWWVLPRYFPPMVLRCGHHRRWLPAGEGLALFCRPAEWAPLLPPGASLGDWVAVPTLSATLMSAEMGDGSLPCAPMPSGGCPALASEVAGIWPGNPGYAPSGQCWRISSEVILSAPSGSGEALRLPHSRAAWDGRCGRACWVNGAAGVQVRLRGGFRSRLRLWTPALHHWETPTGGASRPCLFSYSTYLYPELMTFPCLSESHGTSAWPALRRWRTHYWIRRDTHEDLQLKLGP